MRDIRDAIHALDDNHLINKFKVASEQSPDDEFIQILLEEIKNRELTIEEVLVQPQFH
ncbi:sporulation histidine kinase inhibitor Sda [Cohnella silvisoli]|uniref:Sporulation histidine kinase inhibitor Sda n=1 Tax=Cohnella silvisoli TaxID=2873699 RepID=A0ABV1KM45_9BACL|nr:sporulation histidine kinase inhibitor Sda [Cohnella silvisoli]MCD9020494.1 sporulation histidine kinase inhibitor Sda [Cohnella silvisoli]